MTLLRCGDKTLDLTRPRVMGILNVTPDSFSDGGRYGTLDAAMERARRMVEEGADIIDVGGESTRPGAAGVDAAEEMRRVVPVIEALRTELPAIVSVDTSKPEVMRAAVAAGAGLINDVRALRAPGALEAAAQTEAAVCLMHMHGEPRTMQQNPHYGDVVQEVAVFLEERARVCVAAGISRDRILIDPGFGFGKTLQHNLTLLRHLPVLRPLGFPLLVGLSNKSMFGQLLDAPVEKRVFGSVAAATVAVWLGGAVVRAHDVRATADALHVCRALQEIQ